MNFAQLGIYRGIPRNMPINGANSVNVVTETPWEYMTANGLDVPDKMENRRKTTEQEFKPVE
jgi:hypothetical protein